MNEYIAEVLEVMARRNAGEPEFLQAAREVLETLGPVVERHKKYKDHRILERVVEPERQIMFRVAWTDDKGRVQVNRGFRVQFNSAIGPYKGGIRFHPSVNIGILKFLGFEQIFKNSLTTLPMGGAKGGSDFDPKGKSDNEVMRFCQSFMRELFTYIGPDTDVPAGDIGVGGREIGFLYGYYKKIVREHTGVLTGKGLSYGGSLIRPEATGYGATYFAAEMLATRKKDFNGKVVAVSGSGNVAQYTIEKVNQLGGKCITMSDSDGTIVDMEGIKGDRWQFLMDLKNNRRGRIKEYAEKYPNAKYYAGKSVWDVIKEQNIKVDVAFPSATQNEINKEHAVALVKNGCFCVSEGANMPSTPEAIDVYLENNVLYGPAKAANAGGVATSGLEMSQNSMRLSWSREEVDAKLHDIMRRIHASCRDAAETYGFKPDNYAAGANIAGFVKVANAMYAAGIV